MKKCLCIWVELIRVEYNRAEMKHKYGIRCTFNGTGNAITPMAASTILVEPNSEQFYSKSSGKNKTRNCLSSVVFKVKKVASFEN